MTMPPNPNKGIHYDKEDLRAIYLAGGCFWGTQAYVSRLLGVAETTCGYANGTVENPTYKQVCTEYTGHAETVRVLYNPQIISLETLLLEYFKTIDPLTLNRQGNDIGSQYRTGIYYADAADLPVIEVVINIIQERYDKPVVTEVLPVDSFYNAEEHHQEYLEKNPDGYCHVDLSLLHCL